MLRRGARVAGPRTGLRGTVLLLGNYGPSLAASRSLARAGFRVIAGDGGEFAVVAQSNTCAELWRHPVIDDELGFMTALESYLQERPEISLILPLRGRYLEVLARRWRNAPGRPAIAMADPDVIGISLDKERMFRVAQDAGVPVEDYRIVASLDALIAAADMVGYPCIVRPTTDTQGSLPGGRKAVIAPDERSMVAAFPVWPGVHETLIVQRYAPGPRHNVHFAARDGRIIARAETMALRTDRFDGTGLGVEGISVALDPALGAYCDRIVEHLGYTGVGLIQFLVPPGREPHFLEINPRLGTALAFVQHLGLDLALAACELAGLRGVWAVDPAFQHRVGERYAWTSKDLNGLLDSRTARRIDRRAQLQWLGALIFGAARADVHLTFAWRDPLPTVVIYAGLLPIPVRWRRQGPR